MSYIRTDGYSLKDPDDDAAFQVMVGDMQRLALAMYKGSPNSAYVMAPWAAAAINGANGYNGLGSLAGGPGGSGVDGAGPGGVAGGAGGAGSPGGPTGAAPVGLDPSGNLAGLTDTNEALSNLGIGRHACLPTSTTTYTSGSGTHTFGTLTRRFIIYIIGAGGGGGGSYNSAGSVCAAGGGGGAGAVIVLSGGVAGGPSITYSIGAAGAKGTSGASPTNGTVGGDTVITTDLGAYTSGGGAGGISVSLTPALGGSPQYTVSMWPQVIGFPGKDGQQGSVAFDYATPTTGYVISLFGGPGGGGYYCNAVAAIGAGGNGGAADYSSAGSGTDGAAGRVVIFESTGIVGADGDAI